MSKESILNYRLRGEKQVVHPPPTSTTSVIPLNGPQGSGK